MQTLNKQSIDAATKIQQIENNINQIELDETQTKAIEDLRKIEEQIILLSKRQEEFENYGKMKPLKHSNQQLSQQIKQLELRMIEMDNQLLNTKTLCRKPEILNLENNFKKNMIQLRQEVQQEYKNIYKEMNGLKCDLDYVMNSSVKLKITNKIKTQNINLESNKILFINLLELETFIEELDHYENTNTQRLLDELKNCDQEKLKALNFQLAGTKRRYLNEIKKIEYKFQILKELMQPNSPQEKYTIQLNQQMNTIVQRLHKNVDILLLRISEQSQ